MHPFHTQGVGNRINVLPAHTIIPEKYMALFPHRPNTDKPVPTGDTQHSAGCVWGILVEYSKPTLKSHWKLGCYCKLWYHKLWMQNENTRLNKGRRVLTANACFRSHVSWIFTLLPRTYHHIELADLKQNCITSFITSNLLTFRQFTLSWQSRKQWFVYHF